MTGLFIVVAALAFLMLAAYRGYSVILCAPIAAMGAVLLTDPSALAPVFSGIFMERMAGFAKLYFPVFLLAPCSASSSSCRAFRAPSCRRCCG